MKRAVRRFPPDCFRLVALLLVFNLLLFAQAVSGTEASALADCLRVRHEISVDGVGDAGRTVAIAAAEQAVVLEVLDSIVGGARMASVALLADRTDHYISRTDVLRHEQAGDRTTVEVEVYVKHAALRYQAAALLLRTMHFPPVVAVIVAEQVTSEMAFSVTAAGIAQTCLSAGLRDAHVNLADTGGIRVGFEQSDLVARIRGDLEAAGAFARRFEADVVVMGEAVSVEEVLERGANVVKNKATVTVRVFSPRDGVLLDANSQEAVVHSALALDGATQAIQDACAKLLGEGVVTTVLSATASKPQDLVSVTIMSPGQRIHMDVIEDALAGVAGVLSLEETYFSAEQACLRLNYAGSMSRIVEALAGLQPAGFSLEVHQVVDRDMTVRVVSAP